MMLGRASMGRETRKIIVSVLGAGAGGILAFLLLEAAFSSLHGSGETPGRVLLFRFQLSAMLAMGIFAGLAVVIYAKLSRSLALRDDARLPEEGFMRKDL
jgi:hypothetical protein